jgi:hypothetical protein
VSESADYLLVIGEREASAWILRESRMAFPATRRAEVDQLAVGDRLFLLTTRGCFHNPGRDRTRGIGRATVASPVVPLEPVPHMAWRDSLVDATSALRHSRRTSRAWASRRWLIGLTVLFARPDWACGCGDRWYNSALRMPVRSGAFFVVWSSALKT